jgi:peptidoglycan hydrolase-like protein with peptidoglycan-binding domain
MLMRLTQENLNRVGCEVGTADGVAGGKTRRGHEAYLKAQTLSADLFPLGSADLLRHLIAATGTVCEKLPPVALTPASMSGDWSFTTRCGANSRNRNKTFTGAFRLRHAGGGTYTGRIRMSNGIIGDISASLQGRSVNAVMNWGLLIGKTRMRGSVADEALVIYGRDDDRCRITARKR